MIPDTFFSVRNVFLYERYIFPIINWNHNTGNRRPDGKESASGFILLNSEAAQGAFTDVCVGILWGIIQLCRTFHSPLN